MTYGAQKKVTGRTGPGTKKMGGRQTSLSGEKDEARLSKITGKGKEKGERKDPNIG